MLLAMIVMAPGAWAADAPESAAYRFAPGDVIEVAVVPQSKFDRSVTVQPDGKISFPIVGQIQAAGLTVDQLAEQLRAGLNRNLVDPRVTVTLKELNKRAVPRVSLLGAVRTPSVYEIKDGTTVAELLASGGGPTTLADLQHVTITRSDRSVMTIDLSQSARTGRLDRNTTLQAGDLVVVPEGAPPTVLVLGEVTKPGSYEIQGEARLLDALSLAGGPTTKADLRHVTLGRAGTTGTRSLDLQPLLAGEQTTNPELNVPLRPGDTIVLGETSERVYILGRVQKPDVYPIKPNDRILDGLAKAGGAASDGELGRAVLVRRDSSGQPVATELDMKKMMSKANMAQNDLLRPGDVLYIPDKKTRRSPGELLLPLAGLISVFH